MTINLCRAIDIIVCQTFYVINICNLMYVFVYMYSNHTNHMVPWRQGPPLPTPATTKIEARDQRSSALFLISVF
jgi:hypothetical protein